VKDCLDCDVMCDLHAADLHAHVGSTSFLGHAGACLQVQYKDAKGTRSRPCMMAVDVDRGQLIISGEQKGGMCCKPKVVQPSNLHKCALCPACMCSCLLA
jgi:hypothetical protein